MHITTDKRRIFKDILLCMLPIPAFLSMQYRVDNTLLNISLFITLFDLIGIWALSVRYFSIKDYVIVGVNIVSLLITLVFFPGAGVALNFLNLLLCVMIFNKVEFSKQAIIVTRIMLIASIVLFFATSTYTKPNNWISFYDKNGSLINNNTVALIIVALFINISTLILSKSEIWRHIIVFGLLILSLIVVEKFGCRSAMLFFACYGILMFFSKKLLKNGEVVRKLCTTFLIISFVFPILYIFLYGLIGNFDIIGKGFFSGRERVWLEVYKQIKLSPLFGSGTKFIIDYGSGITESAHNMLLGLWKNLGLIPVFSIVYYYALNNKRRIEDNVALSKIAIISIACFESFLMDSRLYLLFLLAFPFAINSCSKNKNSHKEVGMIPKVIHYCWFGNKPLPKLAKKCIASWKKYCPDYEIKEWNESNFDIHSCKYAEEAYNAKKYAFVSDYARFKILYEHGGVYFDTDVELIKPLNKIIENGSFMGVEDFSSEKDNEKIAIAPGLGIAAKPGMEVYKELLDFYHTLHFKNSDGSLNLETVVSYTTNILFNNGLRVSDEIQVVNDINIYPQEYFNPCDMHTKKIVITEKTVSIHHYAGSWLSKQEKFKRFVRKIVGNKIYLSLYGIRHKNEKK